MAKGIIKPKERFEFLISSDLSNLYFYIVDNNVGLIVSTMIVDRYGEYSRYKHLCNGKKIAKIVRIETARRYVGCGLASRLLKQALEYLDQSRYNVYLLVSPQPRDEDKLRSVSDLKMFYEKFGFVKTFELLPTMFRKATLPTLGV